MKALFVTLITCLSILNLSGQAYEVNWGPEYRKQGGMFSAYYLGGFTDDTYHMVMQPIEEPTLLSFDLNHKLLNTQTINFGNSKDPFYFGGFYKTQSGNFGIFSELDKRTDEMRTYIRPFDGVKFGELSLIHAQTYNARGQVAIAGISAGIESDLFERMVSSPNKSKVVFANNMDARENRRQEVLKIAVFDADFQLQWEKEYSFEEKDDEIQIIRSAVSDNGNVYLLTRLTENNGIALGNSLPRYGEYRLYKIQEGGSQVLVLPLSGDQVIQYAGIFLEGADEDEITVAGMYKEEEKSNDLAGIFHLQIKEDLTLENIASFPFEQEFLEGLISKRANRKEKGLDADFFIKTFFKFSNGTVGFIAEETYIKITNNPDTKNRPVYHTNELVLALFSPEQRSVKVQKIDKEYQSAVPTYVSYASAIGNDKLFLVYNTYKSREERKELLGSGLKQAVFTDLTVIDKTGDIIDQESLFNTEEEDGYFLPMQSDYNQDQMILLTFYGKYYQCGLLPFTKND